MKRRLIVRGPLDDIVLTPGNREAFELVIGITQCEETPINMYMHGPAGSGKTTVLRARGRERDLLSKRRVMFTHAAELISAVTFGANDKVLEDAGSVDILLVDSLDDFFKDDEVGSELLSLLLKERKRLGLSTIIAGRYPLEKYDLSKFDGVFNDYKVFSVEILDKDGLVSFAKKTQDKCRDDKDNAPFLTDDALSYIALTFSSSLRDIENAVRYLITAADLRAGISIDASEACRLLAL